MARPTEQWGTRIGVIMAVAGSAAPGNFLLSATQRPTGRIHDPYFCALLLLGIRSAGPNDHGKAGGLGLHSCSAILVTWAAPPPPTRRFWLLMPTVVYLYYVVIESWCLGYAWSYLCGTIDLGSDPAEYAKRSAEVFSGFAGDNFDGVMFNGTVHTSVYFWLIVVAANFWLIYRGISKGIEKFCNLAMPIMAVCAIFVLIRVLTLPRFTARDAYRAGWARFHVESQAGT
jgi:SNF family Na+-dependent transporter